MAIALRAALVDNADWIVWHDPQVLEPRPDFVVWSPTFGLLVLEVKAYTAPYVLQTDPHTWLVAGGRERRLNPARQARQAKYAVMDRLKRHPALCLPNPAREGELAFPVNHGVSAGRQARSRGWTQNHCSHSYDYACAGGFDCDGHGGYAGSGCAWVGECRSAQRSWEHSLAVYTLARVAAHK